jgi:hypothetical protein
MPGEDGLTAPHFNHVALTVPTELLNDDGRKRIVSFYEDAFGWEEWDIMTLDRKRLVMRAYADDQFVFIEGSDNPMSCDGLEHWGMGVSSERQLDRILDRCRALGEGDPEVDLTERGIEDYGVVKLHNFYVRYLLPLSIEVQYFEAGPAGAAATTGTRVEAVQK